ncbi:DUF1471 domain-containing protein [Rosenbergiella australiborealis]|uniref:DUF1471 domain-containing protein n=1 Tax=Rosenbergiella australiborealis TaxID=1544696 RepID=A0ABS5T4J8_9GAMM|nr:DUF1471 family protein YdgH [Rosenbergiella australiborealis]MBT0726405.1 DUF1471 domain-containing protein [Rosenbergiella australiborealis]
MKFNATVLATALISLGLSTAYAAQELSPQKAATLAPYKRINFSGRFNSLIDVNNAVSKRADQAGAAGFYVVSVHDSNSNGGNWRITADLYLPDAAPAPKNPQYRYINGIKALPKAEAYRLQPYDTVSIRGYYPSQPQVEYAISRAAKAKNADAFFIIRQIAANNGGNQYITAYVYKADAPQRIVQSPDAIPADSEAGKAALATGGVAAKNVEIPGVASSESAPNIGRFFETQTTSTKRYTVTLPQGQKIQEINNITAAQMTPFDTVTMTAHFGNPTEISTAIARRAADKGAKYYHITRQWQNQSGGNLTVTAELFK